ncbi:MAG: S8 family serine peptidase, partial [Anaerolineales bacterium]
MNKKRIRLLVLAAVLVVAFAIALPAGADKPTFEGQVEESPNGVYIVQMIDMPVVAYEGDIKGYKATKPAKGDKINPNHPAVVKYIEYLDSKHDEALAKVGGGRKLYDFRYSYNGFAAELTLDQANQLSFLKEVVVVNPDELVTVDTSTTPDFLGLTAEGGAWDMGYTGEDIIIGIVDSGIWPESFSFSDRTGENPKGKEGKLDYHQIPGWHGKCVPGEDFTAADCNQKLIGAQYYNAGYGGNAGIDAARPWEFNSPRDYNGHGTHTASTSGGNADVPAEAEGVDLGTISGMAPRARIAMYKALWSNEDGSQSSGFTVDLTAAIDQAVADGVDVINYSISGSTTLMNSSVGISFLFAADAGVFVAASAGNDGPGASTVAHNNPWLSTVAAGTHDRFYAGTVTLGDSTSYNGASLDSRGAGPADLVYAGDVGMEGVAPADAALCFADTLDPALVAGKIVVCDRGLIARIAKSAEVARAGGIGMVHANVGPASLNAD